jgi:glycosyltransferase involved in cell wall biosynthesis
MPHVVSAIMFSPRGGSAHTARALVRGLNARGYAVRLLAGSCGENGTVGNAPSFYDDDVVAVDFGPALSSPDPQRFVGPPGTAPMHPSYEDRDGAPDVVFAALDDLAFEVHVRAWSRELQRAGAADADVLHLHHLTPLNEAAARVAPRVPVVGHLHGTELLMLERIAAGAPPEWRHAEQWAVRLRSWAQRCARIVVVEPGLERAANLLELPAERLVPIPNGVDFEQFHRSALDRDRFWHEALLEHPRGWLPGRSPGSATYSEVEVGRLAGGAILLYVGRFTSVKRLDRLIEAFGRAKRQLGQPAGLVLVGGHPGEVESEHPARIAAERGVPDVFLAGWREHDELPQFFSAADALVLASEREQFGLAMVEAMACELPVVATRSLGPEAIVEDGATGWLVGVNDRDGLARAIAEVVQDEPERRRRGGLARLSVSERFAWSSIVAQLAGVIDEVRGEVLAGNLARGGQSL